MGFKGTQVEKLNDLRKKNQNAENIGSELIRDGNRIEGILEGIKVQDENDQQTLDSTGKSYQEHFNKYFQENVSPIGDEIQKTSADLSGTVSQELNNVRKGIDSLDKAGSVSEVGNDAAESGKRSLENSAKEYEDIVSNTEALSEDSKNMISQLRNNTASIFKK